MRLAVLLAMLAGCATPYQQSGFTGGYTDRPMGEGRFFVEVQVNGYTSSGTALQYLHRRSQEFCTGAGYASYAFEDSASDATYGAVAIGNTVTTYSKPEMSAIVRCTGREPPPFGPSSPSQAAPVTLAGVGSAVGGAAQALSMEGGWWCAEHDQPTLGLCGRVRSSCEAFREQMKASGTDYAECTHKSLALCYRARTVGEEVLSCHPSWTSCAAVRSYDASQQGREILTDCSETP